MRDIESIISWALSNQISKGAALRVTCSRDLWAIFFFLKKNYVICKGN
jgi:hypothetical protein